MDELFSDLQEKMEQIEDGLVFIKRVEIHFHQLKPIISKLLLLRHKDSNLIDEITRSPANRPKHKEKSLLFSPEDDYIDNSSPIQSPSQSRNPSLTPDIFSKPHHAIPNRDQVFKESQRRSSVTSISDVPTYARTTNLKKDSTTSRPSYINSNRKRGINDYFRKSNLDGASTSMRSLNVQNIHHLSTSIAENSPRIEPKHKQEPIRSSVLSEPRDLELSNRNTIDSSFKNTMEATRNESNINNSSGNIHSALSKHGSVGHSGKIHFALGTNPRNSNLDLTGIRKSITESRNETRVTFPSESVKYDVINESAGTLEKEDGELVAGETVMKSTVRSVMRTVELDGENRFSKAQTVPLLNMSSKSIAGPNRFSMFRSDSMWDADKGVNGSGDLIWNGIQQDSKFSQYWDVFMACITTNP